MYVVGNEFCLVFDYEAPFCKFFSATSGLVPAVHPVPLSPHHGRSVCFVPEQARPRPRFVAPGRRSRRRRHQAWRHMHPVQRLKPSLDRLGAPAGCTRPSTPVLPSRSPGAPRRRAVPRTSLHGLLRAWRTLCPPLMHRMMARNTCSPVGRSRKPSSRSARGSSMS